ncbi:unnamed protein product [Prorocentrum cordatum]|uniref:CobW/HypB/UreG nucleotide-binding domain-containing protein n=1 Tax=Prorocentrum cordatum TaxID=2364126 RepID=A0ABN9UMG1_9DINO|nr:unnamed protein product [Polarella glacialis]
MAEGWEELLKAAEQALREDPPKFFDGVQHINTAMETFAKDVLEDETGRVTKEPADFLRDLAPGLQAAQKDALRRMFEVRGDVITGLGAHKRAAVDYQCAADLSEPQDQASVLNKRSRAEQAAKGPRTATDKVPVTVITGFLGSGKTTLLNRILKDQHGKRIGIIENEFGEVGIDDGLIDSRMTTEENIVEMNNGCICCTVRGDLIAGLKKFVKSSQKSGKLLDAVIIETTGLADPAPVAQTFFADEFVQQKMCPYDFQMDEDCAIHAKIKYDEQVRRSITYRARRRMARGVGVASGLEVIEERRPVVYCDRGAVWEFAPGPGGLKACVEGETSRAQRSSAPWAAAAAPVEVAALSLQRAGWKLDSRVALATDQGARLGARVQADGQDHACFVERYLAKRQASPPWAPPAGSPASPDHGPPEDFGGTGVE